MEKWENLPQPKSKDTIINEMMLNCAEILKRKYNSQTLICELLEKDKKDLQTVKILKAENKRIKKAIQLIEKNAGCWS